MTTVRRRCWVAGAGLLVAWLEVSPAQAQTGKGAIRDDSVYCQNWPGGPSRPDYPGTGPQTPCGPAFQRPQPQPEPREPTACPASGAGLEPPAGSLLRAAWAAAPAAEPRARLWLAAAPAADAGLWVAGHKLGAATDPDFKEFLEGSDLRSQIFCAMRDSAKRRFVFASFDDLEDNILIREEAIKFLRKLIADMAANRDHPENLVCRFSPFNFQIAGSQWEGYLDPRGIEIAGQRYAGRSARSATAHEAMEAFRGGHSRLECLMGVQLTFLHAVDQALADGPAFDALHPLDGPDSHALYGIGIGLLDVTTNRNIFSREATYTIGIRGAAITSFAKHLVVVRYHILHPDPRKPALDRADDGVGLAGSIARDDMVPGDYVYLSNLPDYLELWRGLSSETRRRVSGAWAGENAVYMGAGKFFGLGFTEELSEDVIKQHLAAAYNNVVAASNPAVKLFHAWSAVGEDIEWTLLAGPTLEGNPSQAGMFASP